MVKLLFIMSETLGLMPGATRMKEGEGRRER